MAMFETDPVRPEAYREFERPLPEWFRGAALGIFVHWGPYSVPAWACLLYTSPSPRDS